MCRLFVHNAQSLIFPFPAQKRKSSLFAFGEFDSFWLPDSLFVHTVFVFSVHNLCFLNVFVVL